MSSEFESSRQIGHEKKRKNTKEKCCHTGLHHTENGVCVQSLKPFKMSDNTPISKTVDGEFVRQIFESNVDTAGSAPEEDNNVMGIDAIIRQFQSCFDRNEGM